MLDPSATKGVSSHHSLSSSYMRFPPETRCTEFNRRLNESGPLSLPDPLACPLVEGPASGAGPVAR